MGILIHIFFYYAEMRRKTFKCTLNEIFLKTIQKEFTIEPKSYTAMLLYFFFDSLLSTCPDK